MILGTYHFNNNNDLIKSEKEDLRTPKKQAEIMEVVNSLLQFKPNKIFIEWRPGSKNEKIADSLYTEYLNNRYSLGRNEVFQLGFRMAKQLNHQKLYCVDAEGQFLYDTLVSTAKVSGQFERFQAFFDSLTKVVQNRGSLRNQMTIKKGLYTMNTKEEMQIGLISNFVFKGPELGKVGEYGGAEMVGEWYKRNIRMYSNMIRTTEAGDERLFLIVGAAHKPIIQHFFENNPDWEVVDVNKYLKK